MNDIRWTESEKKLSRRVFEAALHAELEEIKSEFKSKAAEVATPDAMWEIEAYLAQKRRELDAKYDYRYSQLLYVFGRLVREGRLREDQLEGLSSEKITCIRRMQEL